MAKTQQNCVILLRIGLLQNIWVGIQLLNGLILKPMTLTNQLFCLILSHLSCYPLSPTYRHIHTHAHSIMDTAISVLPASLPSDPATIPNYLFAVGLSAQTKVHHPETL